MPEIHNPGCAPHVKECRCCKQTKQSEEFQDLGGNEYVAAVHGPRKPKVENYKRKICNSCRANQKRDAGLRARYGISLDQYNELLKAQNGVCAICESTCPTGRNLAVDHSHKTGKVRGLLCVRCNQGLGHFMDKETLIARMLDYARKHNEER